MPKLIQRSTLLHPVLPVVGEPMPEGWGARRSTDVEEEIDTERRASSELVPATGPHVVCRACGHAIAAQDDRMAFQGQHVHRRMNPAGIEFEFGCFRKASGALVVGEPTFEHTWFPGYAWRYSLCGSCSAHLGWRFTGTGGSFHGLILDRLSVEPSEGPS